MSWVKVAVYELLCLRRRDPMNTPLKRKTSVVSSKEKQVWCAACTYRASAVDLERSWWRPGTALCGRRHWVRCWPTTSMRCVNDVVVDHASDIREEDGDKHLTGACVRMDGWSTTRLSSPCLGCPIRDRLYREREWKGCKIILAIGLGLGKKV
jgi:hypothetical protein